VGGSCESFLVTVAVKFYVLRGIFYGQRECVVGDMLCEEFVEGEAVGKNFLQGGVVVAEEPLKVIFYGEDAAWF